MSNEKQDLFILLLKLKSYLVSMIDDDTDENSNLYFTEEYLDKRYPEKKEEIISLLQNYELNSDSEIVYNEQVHHIFKEMVESNTKSTNLDHILKQQKINAYTPSEVEKFLENFQHNRDSTIKEMVGLLLKLTKYWSNYHEIETLVDDYIELDEKEVLRPEEEERFQTLDKNASLSLDQISAITKKYLELWIDFLFKFGGDIQLREFTAQFDELNKTVNYYYNELFLKSGLKISDEDDKRFDDSAE